MSDAQARKIVEAFYEREKTAKAWGVELIDAGEGRALVALTVRKDMLNGHGTMHGGLIFALAGTAFAYAANSRNAASVAQHATISYLAPARFGERLTAEAREIAVEGRTSSYESIVRAEDGRVVAVSHGLMRTTGQTVVDEGDLDG